MKNKKGQVFLGALVIIILFALLISNVTFSILGEVRPDSQDLVQGTTVKSIAWGRGDSVTYPNAIANERIDFGVAPYQSYNVGLSQSCQAEIPDRCINYVGTSVCTNRNACQCRGLPGGYQNEAGEFVCLNRYYGIPVKYCDGNSDPRSCWTDNGDLNICEPTKDLGAIRGACFSYCTEFGWNQYSESQGCYATAEAWQNGVLLMGSEVIADAVYVSDGNEYHFTYKVDLNDAVYSNYELEWTNPDCIPFEHSAKYYVSLNIDTDLSKEKDALPKASCDISEEMKNAVDTELVSKGKAPRFYAVEVEAEIIQPEVPETQPDDSKVVVDTSVDDIVVVEETFVDKVINFFKDFWEALF